MQLFVSDSNSLLSDLHPLKISNSLSTTLTQLHRQRREDWVSILSLLKVDATIYLDITRNGRVIRRVRERQKNSRLKRFKSVNNGKKSVSVRIRGVSWTKLIRNFLFTPRVESSSQNIGRRSHEPCFCPCCFRLAAASDGRKSKQRTQAKTRELMAFIFTM